MARRLGDGAQVLWKSGAAFATSGTGAARTYTIPSGNDAPEAIGFLVNISFQDQGEDVDVTALSDANRVFLAGKGSIGGSLSMFYDIDDDDTQQSELTRGASGNLVLRPNPGTGNKEWIIPIVITGISWSIAVAQGIPLDMTYRASGDLIIQDQA